MKNLGSYFITESAALLCYVKANMKCKDEKLI